MNARTHDRAPTTLDDACLAQWPLPVSAPDSDKEDRGRVLVIGGSRELGGAVMLAGVAALRAGAGKVAIATSAAHASVLAMAFPEARVIALDETRDGGMLLRDDLFETTFDAVLIGPGLLDCDAITALVEAVLQRAGDVPMVLDAAAMDIVGELSACAGRRVLLTPHAGELAHLSGLNRSTIVDDPVAAARTYATSWKVTLALKGATSVLATAEGGTWVHRGGNAGLGMSGSGDTLAGIIVGLAARGATLDQAAAWGIVLHARAGEALAHRIGPLGFLAREIPAEIPALMDRLRGAVKRGGVGFTSDR